MKNLAPNDAAALEAVETREWLDSLDYVLQQGDKSRKEVLRIVAHEMGDFLRNVDLSSEVVKVLTGIQVEVNASIRFKPSPDGASVVPRVDTTVGVVKDNLEDAPRPSFAPGDAKTHAERPEATDPAEQEE